jgi:serine protease Do
VNAIMLNGRLVERTHVERIAGQPLLMTNDTTRVTAIPSLPTHVHLVSSSVHSVCSVVKEFVRRPRLKLLGLALALAGCGGQEPAVIAAADGPVVEQSGGLQFATSAAGAQLAPALQDTIEGSRRTAIVRAAERVAPAVVSVNVIRRQTVQSRSLFEGFFIGPGVAREVQGLGSGFVIDARGYVLTNEHVVRDATEVVVTTAAGRDFQAEVVGTDEVTDLALLRLTDPQPTGLRVAELGRSDDLVIGEWVVAIGNPFGFLLSNNEPTVTAGVISGLARNIIPGGGESRGYYLDMIQTDASINPGNSGGPLVNALGEVIGVNSSIISETGGNVGLGFAIPIDRARRIADALLREGAVRRVWVGLEVRPAEPNRFGRSHRIEIAAVVAGSPAEAAGVRTGMTIDLVNGRAVNTPLDWEARLLDTRVGEPVEITVVEGDRRRALRFEAHALPSLTAERIQALADFEFVTVTPAIRAERGLVNERGALIVQLSEDAQRIGLREGDLIVQINRTPVGAAQEAAELLRRLAGQGPVRVFFERQGRYGSVSFQIGG